MAPYLTRKYASLLTESQKSQEKNKPSVTKTTSKAGSVTNKEPKKKGDRAASMRLITKSKNVLAKKKSEISTDLNKDVQEESQIITRYKKLKKTIDKKASEPDVETMTHSSSSTNKQQPKDVKRKKISKRIHKNVSNSRQMSLKESFLNQSRKKSLRPRQKVKNSENDSALITNHLSPSRHSSIVLVKRISRTKEKVPVYKCLSPEHSAENATEVYEFNFNIDDSKERLPKKKRKKPTVKKQLVSKKKTISKKRNVQNIEDRKTEPTVAEPTLTSAALKESNVKSVKFASKEMQQQSRIEFLQNNVSVESPNKNALLENSEKVLLNDVNLKTEQTVQLPLSDSTNIKLPKDNTKPAIVSVQDLGNKKITVVNNSQISKSDDFMPFRPTNVFNNKSVQYKNTLNNSLFERSLSPIVRSSENLELNSPWRASPLFTFSQVRNVFQSTPQNKKYDITAKKFTRVMSNEFKNFVNVMKGKDILLRNNENTSPEGYTNTSNSKRKSSIISRKFGTEITNIDHSVQSNVGKEINGRTSAEVENIQPNIQLSSRINSTINNFPAFDSTENKEDSATNYQTSKTVVKKEMKEVPSPQKIVKSVQSYNEKENLDPTPGPSGLQKKVVPLEQENVLRQSNLNNFLNVMDMPQSTSFKTAHGIFDDAPSTPISSKLVKKPIKSDVGLENAFGFSDDSNENLSNVENNITNDEKQKEKSALVNLKTENKKPLTKLSIGKIKKFLVDAPEEKVEPLKNRKNDNTVIKELSFKAKEDVEIDIPNFSDTFDVLSEMDENSTVNRYGPQLFADLEPSHFTRPPKHSYKRKRAVKFNILEDENEEGEEPLEHEIKRKKTDKVKKEQEKRLMAWVNDINKTFDEIDQHELMVE
ncbi:PREDICTED: uncharacterized protein LOC107189285 [Dufourea novaeangliae]|uniref:uncharacterized protein LOC107189285 n=1 Tax=Dufourea novaeangliae TaxID=178035 RepID=UPI000767D435|nr:PREDICTED: uncharacterized protein LOC107189285 [Dufourea novaeangliae]